ncbi:MAG TPA: NAD(P)-dependent oxidoreductase [Candidatus Udaeobacter sp.]|nr:NAD(P)-dependent oxidoreductase [Candidatus Udaeobacter sp.]
MPKELALDFQTRDLIVTGAAGWLGVRFVDTLIHGLPDVPELASPPPDARVRCLVLPGDDPSALRRLSDRIDIVEGDVRDPAACARLFEGTHGSVLFHIAGIIHPRRVDEFYEINVDGTRRVLEAANAAGARRAVVMSSNSPCGTNPNRTDRFDENSPYHPYMNYGRSKMLMEIAVRELRRSGSVETVLIRGPWFYGPYQPPRQTLFLKMIRDGKAPIVGDGNNVRSMAYLDNLCQGLMLAALRPGADRNVYWIADERPYTMNEVVDTVERLLETEFDQKVAHKRLRLPGIASDVAQLVDAGIQSLGAYHQKIHVLSEMNKNIACSIDGARAALGYAPTVALEEGMRRSIRWCIENRQL